MEEENTENIFFKDGLHFECQQCSHCCRDFPGLVKLSQEDLLRLAAWAELTAEQFKQVYCRSVECADKKTYLVLKELSNCDCIFWQNGGCIAYEARPLQCRTFPFWTSVLKSKETWEEAGKSCPGINKGKLHVAGEIKNQELSYRLRDSLTL